VLTGIGSGELRELSLFDGRANRHQLSAKTSTVLISHVPRDLFTSQQVTGACCWAVDEPSRAPVCAVMMAMVVVMTYRSQQSLVAFICI